MYKYVTEGYEPKQVLQYFEDISRIPRGSGNEAGVAQYLYDWGKALGLDAYKDEHNNVVLKKKGSAGCENLEPVILQGHTDIVAVKLPESDHNFLTDPLPIYVEDGLLKSKGTTLGADNGNAVAYMMGVLSDDTLVHPPLECIFTANEETGLIGASSAAYSIKPDIIAAVDVTFGKLHSNDETDGTFDLGSGAIIFRGPDVCYDGTLNLINKARDKKIPFEIEVSGASSGTDATVMQNAKGAAYSFLISIPLKYMHQTVEMLCLDDISACSDLFYLIASGGVEVA